MRFRPKKAKSHREAIAIPRGNQQGKAHPKKPGLMLTFAPFLGQQILCPSLGLHNAIPDEIQYPVLGGWQDLQGFLNPPRQQ
jgi:hypothetical protein